VTLAPVDDCTLVEAPWLPEPARLQDRVELDADGRFVVVGRSADMIEVAGKRASLGDLTRRLLGVSGVRDAVVVQLDTGPAALRRVAALAVAPGLAAETILAQLRDSMDPAFLPRPLLVVESLPTNELGKVSRDRALEMLGRGPPAG
jgi:acyl-coenzyme A synthetase/AMP-(fatty) acid ligase